MARWYDMQEKARKLIDEGMTILKSGVHDAGFLAESTAGAARLHVDASRKRFELYRTLHDLGAEFMDALRACPAGQVVELTPAMADLVKQAVELDGLLKHDEEELERFSVVKGEKGGAPKPMKPRSAKRPTLTRKSSPGPARPQAKRPGKAGKKKPR